MAPTVVAPPVIGVVVDPAGRPLTNVQIILEGSQRTTLTGPDGTFVLSALAPGTYHLTASLIGYAPGHVEVVVPESGGDVAVRISLVPSPLAIEGVIVTGSPAAANPLTVTHSSAQLSGRELDSSLGSTVAQTLSTQPGIATRYNGPAAAVPVIRGLTGERVLVLENGNRTGDLAGTSADHALSVDPLAASRLEVVRGPASLLYGSSALGGVVNVIDTDIPVEVPRRVHGAVAAQLESVSPGGAGNAEINVPLGRSLALRLEGGGRSMDDVRVGRGERLANTYLNNAHGELGLGFSAGRFSGGIAADGRWFEYGLPFSPGADEAGVHIAGRRFGIKGRGDLSLASALENLRVDGTAQWYTHDEVEPTGEVGTTFILGTQTLDVRTSTRFAGIDGALGASALLRQYDPTGEEALTPPAGSRSLGAFLYQEIPIPGVGHETDEHAPRLQLGGRFDFYRIETESADDRFGSPRTLDFRAFSGSAGVNIPLSHESSIGVSVARAFRAPAVEELFSEGFHPATGSFERGNPDLREEKNLGLEGVLRVQTHRVHAQSSAYYNRISDFITAVPRGVIVVETEDGVAAEVPLAEYLQADATLLGVEGQVETVLVRNVVVGAMGDLVRSEFMSGGPIPYMPAARLGGSARYDNGRISAAIDARHAFEQRQVAEGEFAAGAYTLINTSITYSLRAGGRQHTVTLRGENLLDEVYREATSRIKSFAPNPGRNIGVLYRMYF